jgi:hypothetical protein
VAVVVRLLLQQQIRVLAGVMQPGLRQYVYVCHCCFLLSIIVCMFAPSADICRAMRSAVLWHTDACRWQAQPEGICTHTVRLLASAGC